MTMSHIPVMLPEVLSILSPKAGERYVDGTFGAGGYSKGILDTEKCSILGIDRDPTAILNGRNLIELYHPRLQLVQDCFGNICNHVDGGSVDGFILDIGVSSMQLDQAERGFSFMRDGPLDMRMGEGKSASDIVNEASEEELANLIYNYGEERQSRKIAKAIILARQLNPIRTTLQLANLIEETVPRKWSDKIHPATRTFQALRIAVNDELGELERALEASIKILKPGGRLVIVSFHSLEDRIVKNFLKNNSDKIESKNKYAKEGDNLPQNPFKLVTKKALIATATEAKLNSRARSAKLRAAIRTEGVF